MTAAAEYEVVRVVPPGGDSYSYRLPVPRGWAYAGSVGRALDLDTIPRPIGTFVAGDRATSIVVAVTPLPIEVRVEEWMAAELEGAGWTVTQMQWHRVGVAPKLAIAAQHQRHVRTIAAIPDGGRLYTVYVQGPTARAAEVGDRLWWSAMAFDPCRRGGPGRLEARQDVVVGAHRFEAPISWRAGPPTLTAEVAKVELELRHPSGTPRGGVAVRTGLPSPTPLADRRQATLARLRGRGLVLARTITAPASPWRGVPADWELRTTQAKTPTGDLVEVLLVHGNTTAGAVEVLGVGSPEAKRSWMRTRRAVEIACESLAVRGVGR